MKAQSMVDEKLLDTLRGIPTSHLSDNMKRMSGIYGLQRFHKGKKLVGRALTVRVRPGDNLYIYLALTKAQPGDVLLIDGSGEVANALIGELIMLYGIQRGVAGYVIDGAVRDVEAFYDQDVPCYAKLANHRGPFKLGPGEVGGDVSICGQVVKNGDYIVGDEDGVVVLPRNDVNKLVDLALVTAAREEAIKAEIANGKLYQKWMFDTLEQHKLV
ncbi:RraA family protein [Comamonas kerstersii]|uniref:RraA family protein n=1 Tax=Comamonas kerstersii TaxID=225992 RepID=UPI000986BA4B|nr:RraA family protein [Comamonas kerstersii]OOH85405.1 methyltransferase [Comamonas kerstersii]OOH90589.1 methyltransferase [Comamonas kerstersii]